MNERIFYQKVSLTFFQEGQSSSSLLESAQPHIQAVESFQDMKQALPLTLSTHHLNCVYMQQIKVINVFKSKLPFI